MTPTKLTDHRPLPPPPLKRTKARLAQEQAERERLRVEAEARAKREAEIAAAAPPPPPLIDPPDLSQVTREQQREWERWLRASYHQLDDAGAPAGQPLPMRALAEHAGLSPRLARYLALSGDWQLSEYATPPPPDLGDDINPLILERDYVNVDEASALTGASRSHIYGVLRRPDLGVRRITVDGTRFILRADLPLLRLKRVPKTRKSRSKSSSKNTAKSSGKPRSTSAPTLTKRKE